MLILRRRDLLPRMTDLLEQGGLRREVVAWVLAPPACPSGVVSLPLMPDERCEGRWMPAPCGRPVETAYETISGTAGTLLRCVSTSWRRHQIRVHLASIGSPVVGDTFYGRGGAEALALHTTGLTFTHPRSGRLLSLSSPPPFPRPPLRRPGIPGPAVSRLGMGLVVYLAHFFHRHLKNS